jgi:hypothetical protein
MAIGAFNFPTRIRVLAGLGLIGLIGCGLWGMGHAPGSVENPHWNGQGCAACHAMVQGKPVAIDPGRVDALCVSCHNGIKARAEAHPVGRPMDGEKMFLPKGWPMVGGKIGCVTCHDVKQACDLAGERPLENPTLLRTTLREGVEPAFCMSCHKQEQFSKLNPHIMVDPQTGRGVSDRCLTCHEKVDEKWGGGRRTGQAHLQADEILMCRSCHPRHRDQFSPGHIGAPLSKEKLAFMRARELVGLTTTPTPQLLAQIQSKGELPTLMQPSSDGRVVCTTCHNAHEHGLFPAGSPLGYRAMRQLGGRTRSPVRGDLWCNHCHELN